MKRRFWRLGPKRRNYFQGERAGGYANVSLSNSRNGGGIVLMRGRR